MTERAYHHIRAGLAAGKYSPGGQLSEATLAQDIGVGRTPVREALLLLENEGFIEQVPRYGTFVKKAGRHERQSLYELREILEAYAAGKAAGFLTDKDIEKLSRLCEEIRSSVHSIRDRSGHASEEEIARIAIADMAFHMILLRACGNPLVIKIVADLHVMGRIWGDDRGDPNLRGLKGWVKGWRAHMRILRAIQRRDAAAASQWMTVHLRHATEDALAYFDEQCRNEGANAVGYEWPQAVRDAISRLEHLGPDALK